MQRFSAVPWRRATAVLLSGLLFAAAASAGRTPGHSGKIEPLLEQRLAHGPASTWIVFRRKADLTAAHGRAAYVVDRLRAAALRSQPGARDLLSRHHVRYRSFWAVNAIRATIDDALANELAALPEVEALRA